MIEFICEFLMKWCIKRDKVFYITGTAGPEDVYLIRYYVVKSKWFNIFIHQFLRSDRDDLHDHPWHFVTYLVRGSYTEVKYNPKTGKEEKTYRANYSDTHGWGPEKSNRLVFRKATDQHQVVVDKDLKLAEKDDAALTLFMSGPTIREWGFIKKMDLAGPFGRTPVRIWVNWKEYLGLPSDTKSRG